MINTAHLDMCGLEPAAMLWTEHLLAALEIDNETIPGTDSLTFAND